MLENLCDAWKKYFMSILEEILYTFEMQDFPLLSGSLVEKVRLGHCVFGDWSQPKIVLHTAVSGNPKALVVPE